MKNDKNKIMILAALGVVMVGVGAFNFLGGSPAPAPVQTSKKDKDAEPEQTSYEGSQGTATGNSAGPTGEATGEGTAVAVDPNTGKPVEDPNATASTTPPGEMDVSVLVDPEAVRVSRLPSRDPFNGSRWDPMLEVKPVSSQGDPPRPRPTPRPSGGGKRPTGLGGSGFAPLGVGQGDIALPGVDGGGGTTAMPHVEDVPYKVNGIVRGANSAAVITDGSGKQRIVKVGTQLDENTRVVGVEKGRMILNHRGKIKTVSIDDAGADKGGNKPPQNQ